LPELTFSCKLHWVFFSVVFTSPKKYFLQCVAIFNFQFHSLPVILPVQKRSAMLLLSFIIIWQTGIRYHTILLS